jgi:anaerobic C4-dicarboxylate transporter
VNGRHVVWLGFAIILLVIAFTASTGGALFAIGFGMGAGWGMIVVAFAVSVDPRWSRR